MSRKSAVTFLLLIVVIASVASAQNWRQGRRRGYTRDVSNIEDRNGVPRWENDEEFKDDVFTFVRIEYSSGYGRGGGGGCWTDYPDSDLNLSYRLQELTSMKVDPDGVVLPLTDPDLLNYPFAYIIEPGRMDLTEPEVEGLRQYLNNGGFIMVDDFWGDWQWENFEAEMKYAFPDRELVDVPLEHEIFHCVYDLKEKPQIPSINHYLNGERWEGGYDGRDVHYRAMYDDEGRMMMIVCHNTDLGDGWEREGVSEGYFKDYSEKWAYPMGINIVTYAMTH